MKMSERVKKRLDVDEIERELNILTDKNNAETKTITYKFKDLEDEVGYYLKHWGLEPKDLLILDGNIFVKKSGWYRLAQSVVDKTRVAIQIEDYEAGRFQVKAQVFVKGKEYEDFGLCETHEKGRPKTNAVALQTAVTRAKVRAISQAIPLSACSVEEMDEDSIVDRRVNQVMQKGEEIIQKRLKKTAPPNKTTFDEPIKPDELS